MHSAIPSTVQRLFWDLDPEKLDTVTHQRTIIERVLNHGTLADWHWLVSIYGTKAVHEAVSVQSPLRANGIREESTRLVEMLVK